MKKLLLVFLLSVCLIITMFAQEAQPAAAGMSAERLSRIDQTVQDYVNKKMAEWRRDNYIPQWQARLL